MNAAIPVLLALSSFVLAGCELPRPFAHEGPVVKNALIELPTGNGVRVVVADGLAPEIADPLRQAAVDALADAGIPASGEASLARAYVLTGAVQVDEPQDGRPEAARFVWQLTGRDGLALGAFEKQVSGARAGWLGRDSAVLEAVARDASTQVATLLREQASLSATVDGATEAAVAAAEPALYFQGVSGAPGDGNESLARAMASVLKRTGTPVADSAATASHILKGTVSAEPREEGVSTVSIVWIISERDGKEVGKISQRNPVKTALIAQRWGELAHLVSGAAADGILDAFASVSLPPETVRRLALPK